MELLRCPISMELMEDPVTIATGVTYERKNIEKWLFKYKKSTCPATMQELPSFDLTPNHTLKRLISSLQQDQADDGAIAQKPLCLADVIEQENLVSLLNDIETTPFKVGPIRKLKPVVEKNVATFVGSGGIEALGRVMSQAVAGESSADFNAFRACEEAVGVLSLLPLKDKATVELLLKPDVRRPIMMMLQRGSSEARVHAMAILMKVSKVDHEWASKLTDQDEDAFKSLLELLSDEISTRLSSAALDVLLEMVATSKKNRVKAIEAGVVCTLVELLPDALGHKCEKVLLVLKRLCQLPEGRSALADHSLGVAVISKKILRASETTTKLGFKILWLMCSSLPKEKVIDDMMEFGAVRKLLALLHLNGRSSTKEKAMGMMKMHGATWRQYSCFPCELKDYLILMQDSC